MNDAAQPWKPAVATISINNISKNPRCDFSYTFHARDRLGERGLLISDALFALRNGFVYEEPQESTMKGFYKYQVECQTPNSGARTLRVVLVPEEKSCQIKIITVMWRDE